MSETSDNAGKSKFHNPPLQPTWIIDRSTDTIFKGAHSRIIWIKFSFIPSSGSEEEDSQRFPIFSRSG